MDALQFFTLLAELMKKHPRAPKDTATATSASIGLVPSKDLDKSKFDPLLAKWIPRFVQHRISVRKRGGRKRTLGTRAPMAIPQDRSLS